MFDHDEEMPLFSGAEGEKAVAFESLRLDVKEAREHDLDVVVSHGEIMEPKKAREKLHDLGHTFVDQVRRDTAHNSPLGFRERARNILLSMRDTSYRCPHYKDKKSDPER